MVSVWLAEDYSPDQAYSVADSECELAALLPSSPCLWPVGEREGRGRWEEREVGGRREMEGRREVGGRREMGDGRKEGRRWEEGGRWEEGRG